MTTPPRSFGLASLTLARQAAPLAAALVIGTRPCEAQRELDRAVFLIRRGAETIGREEIVLQHGRAGSGTSGFTLTSTTWYPAERPRRAFNVVIEFTGDSLPAASRLEVSDGGERTVLIGFGPRRITVRTVTPMGESAREHPARGPAVILDDSVFGAHVLPVARAGQAMSLGGTGAASVTVADRGFETTTEAGSAERRLRHLILETERETRHLWYDEQGRLARIEIPSRGLTVVRVAE